jgi:hypothetical protein
MEETMASAAEVSLGLPRSAMAAGWPAMPQPFTRGFADRRAARGSAVPVRSAIAERTAALASQFPVVLHLAGEDSLMACARRFVLTQSRRPAGVSDIGAAFADFIRTLGSAACYAYLADIAELEGACVRAAAAPNAPTLHQAAVACGTCDPLGTRRVILHPSVSLTRSRFPVVSVLEAVRQGTPLPLADCGAQCALISRPRQEIHVRRLPPGAFTFLTLMSQGVPIARAAERTVAALPAFDVAAGVRLLGDSHIVTALR